MYIQNGSETSPTRKSASANPMTKVCVTALRSHLFETYAETTRPFPDRLMTIRKAYITRGKYSSAEERPVCRFGDDGLVVNNVDTLLSKLDEYVLLNNIVFDEIATEALEG